MFAQFVCKEMEGMRRAFEVKRGMSFEAGREEVWFRGTTAAFSAEVLLFNPYHPHLKRSLEAVLEKALLGPTKTDRTRRTNALV